MVVWWGTGWADCVRARDEPSIHSGLVNKGVSSGLAIWASDLEKERRHQTLGKDRRKSEQHRRVCKLAMNKVLAATVRQLFVD